MMNGGTMAIRYDRGLQQEIRRTVANFNKKVSRLEKQGRELVPDRIYTNELKNQFDNRRELKRRLRQLQQFSQRGVEEVIQTEAGRKTTKYQLAIDKQEKALSLRRLTMQRKRLERLTSPTDILRRNELSRVEDLTKIIKRDLTKINREQYKTFRANTSRVLDYDGRINQFQENFFQIVTSEASYAGTAQYKLDYIHQKFSELSPDELLRLAKEDPEIQSLLMYSPTEGNYISRERMDEIMDHIYTTLDQTIASFNFE